MFIKKFLGTLYWGQERKNTVWLAFSLKPIVQMNVSVYRSGTTVKKRGKVENLCHNGYLYLRASLINQMKARGGRFFTGGVLLVFPVRRKTDKSVQTQIV